MKLESILLVVLAVLAGFLYYFPRRRKLKLRIEPIPSARLDKTPEHSEIIGSVRVRERKTGVVAEASPAFEVVVAPVAPVVTLLEQEDLFVNDVLPRSVSSSESPSLAPEMDHHDGSAALPAMERVLSLHVMAQVGRAFEGRRVLELLLQYGLRFGDMSIFHRHEHPSGQGHILFSLAQAVEPGTFDLTQFERQSVPGVSLFMGLPGFKPLHAFDLMVDTARRLAKELDADLVDEQAIPVTSAQLDSWRDEVVEAERRSLMTS